MLTTTLHPYREALIAERFPVYQQRACRYAKWLVGNQGDSEEIVQEAFLRITRRARQDDALDCEKRFASLLFTIVRNLSIDLLRKKGRRKTVPLSPAHEPAADHHQPGDANRLNHQITQLMEQLPENWAEALKLKITGDLTYQEIADVLGCTKAQVRTWIYRARKKLASELEKQGWLDNESRND